MRASCFSVVCHKNAHKSALFAEHKLSTGNYVLAISKEKKSSARQKMFKFGNKYLKTDPLNLI